MSDKPKSTLEKFHALLKEKMEKGYEGSRRFDFIQLLVGVITLTTYCTISPVLAEYQGKQVVYWAAVGVIILLSLIAVWQFICLIGYNTWGKFFRGLYGFVKKAANSIPKWFQTHDFTRILPFAAILGICAGIAFWQVHTTKCYASITEVYGIPKGTGDALTPKEKEKCADYWEIKDYWLRGTMTVTHEDAYHEDKIMGEYSSIYNMAFFQPVDHMVYQYKKSKGKFKELTDETAYLAADDNHFRYPVNISYFDSNGRLLLQMQKKDGSDTFDILTYSLDSEPQLFNSTLLRIPKEEADTEEKLEQDEIISRNAIGTSIMSFNIEVTYNSEGLPDTRRISPHIYNLYGVNGERYVYNQNKQLTALYYLDINGDPICNQKGIMTVSFEYDENDRLISIRYFSDINGEEKIEGFHGVFCEKYEYNTAGNLCVRKHLNQNENRWYDENGVCEYRYTYAGARLAGEEFLDFSGNMTNNKKVNSSSVKFAEKTDDAGNKVIAVSLDPIIRLAEQEPSAPSKETAENPKQEKRQDIISVMSERIIRGNEKNSDKEDTQDQNDDLKKNEPALPDNETDDTDNGEKDDDASHGNVADGSSTAEEKDAAGANTSQIDVREEDSPVRNYTKVCYTVKKREKALHVSYYRGNERIRNEQGFSAREICYDGKFRVMGKKYLDEHDKPCLTVDGYANVLFHYASANGDEKAGIEYRDTGEKLVINTNDACGYAYVVYQPCETAENPNGDTVITLEYHDQNKDLICLPGKGYAKTKQTYNSRGLLVRETYYKKENGNEVPAYRTDYMVAGIDYEYADDGNQICEVYKDASDQSVNRSDTGFAIKYWEFKNGHHVRTHYQGYIDNVLQDVPDKKYGIGSVTYTYVNGRRVEEQYFDIYGNPALRNDIGCASIRKEYNSRGLVAVASYYGTDGEPILRTDKGYASVRYQYDELGREILLRYYGVDQMPVISTVYYCAGMQYQYDQKGNRSDTRYLDVNSNLMNRYDLGYAWVNRQYNADGKLEEERYFDSDEQPVERKEGGYALYKAIYDGKNRVAVKYRDKYGNPVPHTETGYAIATYQYNSDGKCSWELFLDTDAQPVISKKYHCAGFRTTYDEEKNEKTIGYLGLHGETVIRSDLGYAQVCKQYDGLNRLFKESYYDAEQTPILCKEGGYASQEYQYDEKGNVERNIYRDTEGNLTLRKDIGCAVIEYEYDDFGRPIRIFYYGKDYDLDADQIRNDDEHAGKPDVNKKALVFNAEYGCAGFLYHYDEAGNRTDISYIDTDRNIMVLKKQGYAKVHRVYDEYGNITAENYYDADNNPTACRDEGYACVKKKYENGKCTEAAYYDTDGKPVLRKDRGIAMERWQYDELGQCISNTFYDTKGKPVIHKTNLCAAIEYEYDSRGNQTDIWYRGIDGEIMIRPDLGYAHEKREYDSRGNMVKGFYYDTEERLTLSKKSGIAYYEDQFDDNGNWLGDRSHGKNRELKVRKDRGYAFCKNIYDKYGQKIAVYYYGADGKTPILSAQRHCFGIQYEYDKMGDITTTKYVDADGDLMIREDLGYAKEEITTTYDSVSNTVFQKGCFYDLRGKPAAAVEGGYTSYQNTYVCGKYMESRYYKNDSWAEADLTERTDNGYAIIRRKYDNFGQCVSESYYDAEDHPVYRPAEGSGADICPETAYEYDEKGNLVTIKYKNANGNAMIRNDLGYAQLCQEYDEQGKGTEGRYYDDTHRPAAVAPGGYCSLDWIYSNGQCTEIRYYDAEKQLMMRDDENYAIQKEQYDEYRNRVLSSYYNAEDEPVINSLYHCASFAYKYDLLGNMTDVIYLDTEGAVMVREELGFAWLKYSYDDWSRLVTETYYDVDQNPTTDVHGYAGIRYEYDEQGNSHKKPFDLNGAELSAEEAE